MATVQVFLAAVAAADQADADAVVSSQHTSGREQAGSGKRSRAAQSLLDECAAS